MTTTMLVGVMLIVFIVLGFLVAVATLVGHPDAEPIEPDDTDSYYDLSRELDEIANAIPGAYNTYDYDEDSIFDD